MVSAEGCGGRMSRLWLIGGVKALKIPYLAKIHAHIHTYTVHRYSLYLPFLWLDSEPCDVTKGTSTPLRMETYNQPDIGSTHSERHVFFCLIPNMRKLQQSINSSQERNGSISAVCGCKQRAKYLLSGRACNFHLITNP